MTDTQIRRGGVSVSDLALVSHDDTLTGDGTAYRPLSAAGGSASSQFSAAFRAGDADPTPGMPVFASFVSEPGGITTVEQSRTSASEGTDIAFAKASAIGLITSIGTGDLVTVQTSGLITLTEDQWDAIADSSGGLQMGSPYYISAFDNALITPTSPVLPGQYVTRIGVALSATTMFIQPYAPIQVLRDSIVVALYDGDPVPFGSAVYVSSTKAVTAAASDSSGTAQVIGVVVGLVGGFAPIVQFAGVTGTQIDWSFATITGTPLVPGSPYYLATSANPGKLTTTPPVSGSIVQVGVALTANQLILTAPFRDQL